MPPLVSILIPAFNAQEWIVDTIQSALVQTWPRKEIIIVDDGSTDTTLNIVRQHESATLKVIHQENGNACSARNHAFSECQGDYIQWLDADDLLAPDKIERQLTVLGSTPDPNVLLTSAWAQFYYRPQKAKFHPTPLWRDLDPVEWLVFWLSNPEWIMCSMAWLVNRQLTDRAGPWDERLTRNQDGEYFCRVVSLSSYIKFVPESRCYYRMANTSSLTSAISRKAWESLCLSSEMEIRHVLAREDCERTRAASLSRLSSFVYTLEAHAPDLADHLRQRIIELGGTVKPQNTSRKYALARAIIGERSAGLLKEAAWRIHQSISCSSDRWLAKLFGTNL